VGSKKNSLVIENLSPTLQIDRAPKLALTDAMMNLMILGTQHAASTITTATITVEHAIAFV